MSLSTSNWRTKQHKTKHQNLQLGHRAGDSGLIPWQLWRVDSGFCWDSWSCQRLAVQTWAVCQWVPATAITTERADGFPHCSNHNHIMLSQSIPQLLSQLGTLIIYCISIIRSHWVSQPFNCSHSCACWLFTASTSSNLAIQPIPSLEA